MSGAAIRRPSPQVVVSYRRSDAAGYAGRLAADLSGHFGTDQVFRDIGGIAPSAEWLAELRRAIQQAAAVVVVIGPDWLASSPTGRPRLFDDGDIVRLEVATALAVGCPVFPVLVGGAVVPPVGALPSDLARLPEREAIEITDTRWTGDVARLLNALTAIGLRADFPSFPEEATASRQEARAAWFGRGTAEQVRADLGGALAAHRMTAGPWSADKTELSGGSKRFTRMMGGFFVDSARLPSRGLLRVRSGPMPRVEILLREDFGRSVFTGMGERYRDWFASCITDFRRATGARLQES